MPFFKGATDFEIHDSTFNDVKGDYTANNTTTNRNLTNSNNKRVKTVENSYNDGSVEWSTGDGYEGMAARPSGRVPGKSLIDSIDGAQLSSNSLAISTADRSRECRSSTLCPFRP